MIATCSFLSKLPCEIVLPDDLRAQTNAAQHVFDPADERRRFPRQRTRFDAALRYYNTFPALNRKEGMYRVMIRDLSRGGVGFLHGEEMFPGENARLVFPNGTERYLQVKRCRRMGPKCYVIGAEFDEPLHDLTEGRWR